MYHVHEATDVLGTSSLMSITSIDTYHTAPRTGSSVISSTRATEGGSPIGSVYGNFVPPLVHRFTLLKPGTKQRREGSPGPGDSGVAAAPASWNPLELFFSSGLLMSKCDLCGKRLGWKPVLECDDCGLRFVVMIHVPLRGSYPDSTFYNSRAHAKCGEGAPHDCGIRVTQHPMTLPSSAVPLDAVSPLSKMKQEVAHPADGAQTKALPGKRR